MLRVTPISSFAAPELQPAWDDLAHGVPFRGFAWLSTWWKHYGAGAELCVLGVFDANRLVGVAPWYLETSAAEGRVIRQLGTGEVCSDYLTILCGDEDAARVAAALAEFLCGPDAPAWDLLLLEGIDAEDAAVAELGKALAARDCGLHRHEAHRCWRVALPNSWEEFLAMQSKSHRKQLRRLEKEMAADHAAGLHVATEENFDQAWRIFVDLHQRRRQSLNEPGCFASPRFAAFHRDVAEQLLAQRMLRLCWLELNGSPIAAEYQLAGEGITYAYQAGFDPERIEVEPGRRIMIYTVRQAIEAGQAAFDYLRGDEPYKAHWRAEPRPAHDWRIVANTTRARLRHGAWRAADGMKGWLKSAAALVAGGAKETVQK